MTDRDYGREAHEAAERHLEECFVALEHEEDGGEPIWPEMDAPFDGCPTCIIREVLNSAWPILYAGAREGIAREMERVRDQYDFGTVDLTEAAALVRSGFGSLQ